MQLNFNVKRHNGFWNSPNGIEEEYNYDNLKLMIGLTHKKDGISIRTESYELDKTGNKIRISYTGFGDIYEVSVSNVNLEIYLKPA